MPEAVGGYFSLELPIHEEFHKEAIKLNTGRNCLEYILRAQRYDKVYIPYYTCEVILEPIKKIGISYEFYHIDLNLELVDKIHLNKNEVLLYTNYYGLKQQYVKKLVKDYGQQLIVDNTQAFYAMPMNGVSTFYTCRKFFGVPDGAYLYTEKKLNEDFEKDTSWDRLSFLMKRIDISAEAGYADFRQQSERLAGQTIKHMSRFTERMMQSINYGYVKQKRRANFLLLHESLGNSNQLELTLEPDAVPMVYPYWGSSKELKQLLIQQKIYCATYWSNVLKWCKSSDIEYLLTEGMVCIPIDQRYGKDEMKYIINTLNEYGS